MSLMYFLKDQTTEEERIAKNRTSGKFFQEVSCPNHRLEDNWWGDVGYCIVALDNQVKAKLGRFFVDCIKLFILSRFNLS